MRGALTFPAPRWAGSDLPKHRAAVCCCPLLPLGDSSSFGFNKPNNNPCTLGTGSRYLFSLLKPSFGGRRKFMGQIYSWWDLSLLQHSYDGICTCSSYCAELWGSTHTHTHTHTLTFKWTGPKKQQEEASQVPKNSKTQISPRAEKPFLFQYTRRNTVQNFTDVDVFILMSFWHRTW